jgi:hypothetical protein
MDTLFAAPSGIYLIDHSENALGQSQKPTFLRPSSIRGSIALRFSFAYPRAVGMLNGINAKSGLPR